MENRRFWKRFGTWLEITLERQTSLLLPPRAEGTQDRATILCVSEMRVSLPRLNSTLDVRWTRSLSSSLREATPSLPGVFIPSQRNFVQHLRPGLRVITSPSSKAQTRQSGDVSD